MNPYYEDNPRQLVNDMKALRKALEGANVDDITLNRTVAATLTGYINEETLSYLITAIKTRGQGA